MLLDFSDIQIRIILINNIADYLIGLALWKTIKIIQD